MSMSISIHIQLGEPEQKQVQAKLFDEKCDRNERNEEMNMDYMVGGVRLRLIKVVLFFGSRLHWRFIWFWLMDIHRLAIRNADEMIEFEY